MMLRFPDDWRWPALRLRPELVQRSLEVGLVLVLAWQVARLVWLFATPLNPLGEPPPAMFRGAAPTDLTVFARFDPFFRGQPTLTSADTAPTQDSFALFGVRADGRGGGSAIIGTPDGRQASYGVGEGLGGGATLRQIGVDHVVLVRNGARVRLEFSQSRPPAEVQGGGPVLPAAPPPTPITAPSTRGLDPKAFLSAAALTPQMRDGRLAGYRVMARGQGDALRQAGLQDGDVLTAVDGSPLSSERISELPGLLAAATEVEVRFERNGQPMTTRLRSVSR